MTPAELAAARKSLGLSQRKLAAVLGVHVNVVSRWERGVSKSPAYLEFALESLTCKLRGPIRAP